MGLFGDALGALKEKAIALSAKAWLNQQIGSFGSVRTLELDPGKRTAFIEVDLKGETEPVWVRVERYEAVQSGDKVQLKVLEASASREWITMALRQYAVGRTFDLPAKAGMAII